MARSAKKRPTSDDSESGGIDAVLEGLEAVVKELESGDLPLEKALERFEESVRLARRGGNMLDAVEERVETLLADRDETRPLTSEDEEVEDDDAEDFP